MTRKNIKLPEPLFDSLKADKPDHMNWPTYLEQQCLTDNTENLTTTVEVDAEEVVDELKEAIVELNCPVTPDEEKSSEELVAKIEQLEAAVKEATQAAQSTEQTVEDLQG